MAKNPPVEDDNNLRGFMRPSASRRLHHCSARDGEEAVVAKAEMPDLVISDVMMPKISGFEMLDILRDTETLRDVKVIMLTALGQAEDQTRADKLGADRYLVKSQVTLEDIVNVAGELLSVGSAAPEGRSCRRSTRRRSTHSPSRTSSRCSCRRTRTSSRRPAYAHGTASCTASCRCATTVTPVEPAAAGPCRHR